MCATIVGIPLAILLALAAPLIAPLGERAGRPDLLAFGKRPLAPDEPPRLVADVGRLNRDLGFFPRYPLEAGLTHTLDWWRNEHHG